MIEGYMNESSPRLQLMELLWESFISENKKEPITVS
jgi:hypothetical protein